MPRRLGAGALLGVNIFWGVLPLGHYKARMGGITTRFTLLNSLHLLHEDTKFGMTKYEESVSLRLSSQFVMIALTHDSNVAKHKLRVHFILTQQ